MNNRCARLLALDLSLTNAGTCTLFVNEDRIARFIETVTVPPLRVPGARAGTQRNQPRVGADRLRWWHDWFVNTLTCGIDVVYAESPAMRSQTGRVFDIGELNGVLKLVCQQREIPLEWRTPSQIKKFATGMGNADKQRMIDTAQEASGMKRLDEHSADAYWLAQLAFEDYEKGLGDEGLS